MESQLKSKEMKGQDDGYKQSVLRSVSLRTLNRNSLILSHPREDDSKSKPVRQIMRELREEISALKNENTALKRSLKYTRMS
jgi:hypothetical protein